MTSTTTASPLPDCSAPPQPPRRWPLETFRSLRHRNYRLYFFGQLVSLTGSWVQTAALTWLAYHLTHQSWWPALVSAVQVLPTFVLGVWGGNLADRCRKRWLIFVCQATLLVLALLLAGMVWLDLIGPWSLLAVATVCGIVNAIDLPARLSFVIDMVGREDLPNAVALNALQFNAARAVGPALSVLMLPGTPDGSAQQVGLCFFLNGLSFVAVLLALAWMRLPTATALAPSIRKREEGVLAGFRYLEGRLDLVLLLVLSGAMAFFGWPVLSLLPALADKHLGNTGGYGYLLSAIGVGALVAALLVASFGSRLRSRVFLGWGVLLSSAALACLALIPDMTLSLICCAVLGCGLILFFPTAQAVLQLSSTDHNRGRMMGIWSMVLSGTHPAGHLLAGWTADQWGEPLALTLQALGIALAAGAVFAAWALWCRGRGWSQRPASGAA